MFASWQLSPGGKADVRPMKSSDISAQYSDAAQRQSAQEADSAQGADSMLLLRKHVLCILLFLQLQVNTNRQR